MVILKQIKKALGVICVIALTVGGNGLYQSASILTLRAETDEERREKIKEKAIELNIVEEAGGEESAAEMEQADEEPLLENDMAIQDDAGSLGAEDVPLALEDDMLEERMPDEGVIGEQVEGDAESKDEIDDAAGEENSPQAIKALFPDRFLAESIAKRLRKPSIDALVTQGELDGIKELVYWRMDEETIENLTGLQYLRNLTGMHLLGSKVQDISVLSSLTSLRNLTLGWSSIKDITPLTDLINLETLDLTDNQVTDVAALGKLVNLEHLVLNHNPITRIDALSTLVNLETLNLDETLIKDVNPLSTLLKLEMLDINGSEVGDIQGLSGLVNLGELGLYGNKITDVNPLAPLVNLTVLDLSGNAITDITPLANIVNLETVYLNVNHISDLRPLEKLTKLQFLQLGGNEISDLSVLSNLTELRFLGLLSNRISDLSSLGSLTKLEILSLDANQISDLSPLAALTELTSLELETNQVSDITPLANLKNLRGLNLTNNAIKDISAITNLVNLEQLSLAHNEITDVEALSRLLQLRMLRLDENNVHDISSLARLVNVQDLNVARNNINDITVLNRLINLQILNLQHNAINDITPLAQLINLFELDLEANFIRDVGIFATTSFPSLSVLHLSENDIIDLSPFQMAQLPQLQKMTLFNQRNSARADLLDTALTHEVPTKAQNRIKDVDGSFIAPKTFSDNGRYETPHIIWEMPMKDEVMDVSYDWLKRVNIANVPVIYSGTYSIKILPHYPVRFIVDGKEHTITETPHTKLIELPSEPVKQGYTFIGWFTAEIGGRQWDFAADGMPTAEVMLYARFAPNSEQPREPEDKEGGQGKDDTKQEEKDKAGDGTNNGSLPRTGDSIVEQIIFSISILVISSILLLIAYVKKTRAEEKDTCIQTNVLDRSTNK